MKVLQCRQHSYFSPVKRRVFDRASLNNSRISHYFSEESGRGYPGLYAIEGSRAVPQRIEDKSMLLSQPFIHFGKEGTFRSILSHLYDKSHLFGTDRHLPYSPVCLFLTRRNHSRIKIYVCCPFSRKFSVVSVRKHVDSGIHLQLENPSKRRRSFPAVYNRIFQHEAVTVSD